MAELYFGPLTCAGCGLLCDDVIGARAADGGVRLQPECRLGAEWFASRLVLRSDVPAATVGGRTADVDTALRRAAELLRDARRPLVRGFEGATVEDARAALALADRLGAVVATRGVAEGGWPGAPAMPLRGASSATLGEIRDRSRVVVIWREDPESTHPRLLERLGFAASSGALSPSGTEPRTLAVVDDRDTATEERSDLRLRWPRERDLDALVTLHALQRGLTVDAGDLQTQVSGLLERVRAVPHVAFVFGAGLTAGAGGQRRALALHELVRALCRERHAVTLELPRAAGTRGAEDVLAWQSGYAGDVDFAGGHPELVTATQPLDDVDVTVLVEPGPGDAAEIALGGLRAGPDVEVWIRTAVPGVKADGTAHRLDGIPLALEAPLAADAPTAAAILTRLLEEVEG